VFASIRTKNQRIWEFVQTKEEEIFVFGQISKATKTSYLGMTTIRRLIQSRNVEFQERNINAGFVNYPLKKLRRERENDTASNAPKGTQRWDCGKVITFQTRRISTMPEIESQYGTSQGNIRNRLLPEDSGLVQLSKALWSYPGRKRGRKNLYNAGQDFWNPYACSGNKGIDLLLYHGQLIDSNLKWYLLPTNNNGSLFTHVLIQQKGNHWQSSRPTCLAVLLEFSSITNSPNWKDFALPFRLGLSGHYIDGQKTTLGHYGNLPSTIIISGNEGHHSNQSPSNLSI